MEKSRTRFCRPPYFLSPHVGRIFHQAPEHNEVVFTSQPSGCAPECSVGLLAY